MCNTCGCSDNHSIQIRKPGSHEYDDSNYEQGHTHYYTHSHDGSTHTHHDVYDQDHHHSHEQSDKKKILIEQDVLYNNNLVAARNRGFYEAKNIFTLNIVSAPGSGKTSLLERTIKEMGKEISFYVIEGDQQTMNDAERIQQAGAPVIQINTGNGCHLDADMVNKAQKELQLKDNSVLIIENVGNLVCPALFDLGETCRVVIISVTEGDDKPLKYPNMFASAQLCIINKIDLLPYVSFSMDKVKENARKINHHLQFIETSVTTGKGMQEWYVYLQKNVKNKVK